MDVEITDAGKLGHIDWVKGHLGRHTATVETYLRGLEFEPPRKDGAAVAASTSLLLEFTVQGRSGNSTLELQSVQPSPRMESTVPPRYPMEELRRGRQATVLLQIEYDAAGKSTRLYKLGSDKIPESFVKASVDAAVHWQLIPERLDGAPLAGSVIVPVAFKIDRSVPPQRPRTLRIPGGAELNLQPADHPRRICLSQFKLKAPEVLQKLELQLAG